MNPRWELEKLFSLQKDSCIYLQLHEIICVIATCTSISAVVIDKNFIYMITQIKNCNTFNMVLKVFIRLH